MTHGKEEGLKSVCHGGEVWARAGRDGAFLHGGEVEDHRRRSDEVTLLLCVGAATMVSSDS